MPPAFVLSQDQTLRLISPRPRCSTTPTPRGPTRLGSCVTHVTNAHETVCKPRIPPPAHPFLIHLSKTMPQPASREPAYTLTDGPLSIPFPGPSWRSRAGLRRLKTAPNPHRRPPVTALGRCRARGGVHPWEAPSPPRSQPRPETSPHLYSSYGKDSVCPLRVFVIEPVDRPDPGGMGKGAGDGETSAQRHHATAQPLPPRNRHRFFVKN